MLLLKSDNYFINTVKMNVVFFNHTIPTRMNKLRMHPKKRGVIISTDCYKD